MYGWKYDIPFIIFKSPYFITLFKILFLESCLSIKTITAFYCMRSNIMIITIVK